MKDRLRQIKFDVRSTLSRKPVLAPVNRVNILLTQMRQRAHIDVRECRVGRDTVFVLDGCQGSGNSFATVAFKQSQPQPVRLAHHLHSPAQILKAARWSLPTLITIRDPLATAVSIISRWPYIRPDQALQHYVRFYETIEPARAGYVLSPFERTIKELDRVIQEVNGRFGTDFVPFTYTDENLERVRNRSQDKLEYEASRSERKEALREEVSRERWASLRAEAEAVYQRLVGS